MKPSRVCFYQRAYIGACGKPAVEGQHFCAEHAQAKCVSCGAQAVTECCHTGQFVCGAPLCDGCEGWTDTSKASGSWGFMNHSHRRKASAALASIEPAQRTHEASKSANSPHGTEISCGTKPDYFGEANEKVSNSAPLGETSTIPYMTFKMSSDLNEGIAEAYDAFGNKVRVFAIPEERPPSCTREIYLSPEDYGRFLKHAARYLP